MKIQVRKPDGNLLEEFDGTPIGNFVLYNKDFIRVQRDEKGRFIIDEYPEPGDLPVPLEPELDRLLIWFIQNRKGIQEQHGIVAILDGEFIYDKTWKGPRI